MLIPLKWPLRALALALPLQLTLAACGSVGDAMSTLNAALATAGAGAAGNESTPTEVPTEGPPTETPVPSETPLPTDTPTPEPTPTATPLPPATGRVAFVSFRDGNNEIYIMNADGSGQHNLTNDPGEDDVPAWAPDGARLAFASNRDGNDEIYVINMDGS
ncbi:MAG TPA: hypothetical protein VIG92_01075, partial [Rhodospirillales bacterium]